MIKTFKIFLLVNLIFTLMGCTSKDYQKVYHSEDGNSSYNLSDDSTIFNNTLSVGYGGRINGTITRRGNYKIDSTQTTITCSFSDGMPPYKMILEDNVNKLELIDENGQVFTEETQEDRDRVLNSMH